MSLFINNNSGPIYNDCVVTINNGEIIAKENVTSQTRTEQCDEVIPYPNEGNYNEVREYITKRGKIDADFKYFYDTHNRKELCEYLTKEFGWVVDDHSLGANMNRHR